MTSDSRIVQIVRFLSRFNTFLTDKVFDIGSFLSNHKHSGSIGAAAGLAIAIVFAWKFLRSPDGRQRRQQKRRGPSSNSSTTNHENDVAAISEASRIEELQASVKLSLAQTVKKKLNGGRKMTCRLLGVVLEESTPEELQRHATVRPSVLEVLLTIAKSCDVYLMENILDDESGERVLLALENAGLFAATGLIKDKVLFCSTENGRTSFVRQLEPDWHVDSSIEIVSQLSRFIRCQLHVSPAGPSYSAPNVFHSISLEQYFSSMELKILCLTNVLVTQRRDSLQELGVANEPNPYIPVRGRILSMCPGINDKKKKKGDSAQNWGTTAMIKGSRAS